MGSKRISIILGLSLLFGCDMVRTVQESTHAIAENKEAVDRSTEEVQQNAEVVDLSNQAIEDNLKIVQISTAAIRSNAEAVQQSTSVIRENIQVIEEATDLIPKVENKTLVLIFIGALLFFLFALPLIIAHHLSQISRKLSRIEKELKK